LAYSRANEAVVIHLMDFILKHARTYCKMYMVMWLWIKSIVLNARL